MDSNTAVRYGRYRRAIRHAPCYFLPRGQPFLDGDYHRVTSSRDTSWSAGAVPMPISSPHSGFSQFGIGLGLIFDPASRRTLVRRIRSIQCLWLPDVYMCGGG